MGMTEKSDPNKGVSEYAKDSNTGDSGRKDRGYDGTGSVAGSVRKEYDQALKTGYGRANGDGYSGTDGDATKGAK